jgi:transcriptional regulator with XRE-family HTH domain
MRMPTPGDRIKEARESRGWTQEQLAGKAQMSKGFLSDVENNKRNVSAEYVLKIANALGVSLDYLLRGETGREERERQPVEIPPELSVAAQRLSLTYSQTLTLLDTHLSVVARRSNRTGNSLSVDEWINLFKALNRVYRDGLP